MEKKWFIGIDIGGTFTKMAVIGDEGIVLDDWVVKTDTSNNGKNIIKNIAKSINQKLQSLGINQNRIRAIGIGAPAFIDMKKGFIHEAINIGWVNYPLKEEMEFEFGLPVVIDNDANVAALGEMWKGAGKGFDHLICVTLGTGVGGGIIMNGDIVHGSNGMAGEIGHFTVDNDDGFLCNCGKKGCLETVASATGVVRMALSSIKNHQDSQLYHLYMKNGFLTAKDVFDIALKNDFYAVQIVEKVGYYLGFALANLSNVLNPECIVIGGGVSEAKDTLLKPVDAYFKHYALQRVYNGVQIKIASLGNRAGVIGAAWLAKTRYYSKRL